MIIQRNTAEYIDFAISIHGENVYDYTKTVFTDINTDILIIDKNKEFYINPIKHLRGYGSDINKKIRMTTDRLIKILHFLYGEYYDYSETKYINSYTNITLICPIHGRIEKRMDHLLSGDACNLCAEELKRIQLEKDFIYKASKLHNYKYDYSLVHYTTMKNNVIIICPEHGKFELTPEHHLYRGDGCQMCNIITTEKYIQRAKEIHNNYYSYEHTVYNGMLKNIIVTCPIHGDFEVNAGNHLYHSTGCSKCSKKYHYSTEDIIYKIKEIYGDLYDTSLVNYINNYTPINLICPIHGIFKISTKHLLYYKTGCQKCSLSNRKKTTELFKQLIYEKFGDKYILDLVDYVDSKTYITVICPKHGPFKIRPYNLLSGKGCKKCAIEKIKYTLEEFIEKARDIYPEYDYSLVNYIDSKTYITVICPKHGPFKIIPSLLLIGRGCLKCNESHIERDIRKLLEYINVDKILHARKSVLPELNGLEIDFYIPKYKIAIECLGLQHFEPVDFSGKQTKEYNVLKYLDILKRDEEKRKLCKLNNIILLYYSNLNIDYPYQVYENLDELLEIINKIMNSEYYSLPLF